MARARLWRLAKRRRLHWLTARERQRRARSRREAIDQAVREGLSIETAAWLDSRYGRPTSSPWK
jgi:uncharacterized protein YnzC (UPF0291/DUF896 family)